MQTNKFMKLGAKVTAAATMLAMFASVSPAFAASYFATAPSDLMTRQAVSATSDHTISFTLPAGTWTGDMTLTVAGAGWSFQPITGGTCSGGTVTDNTTTGNTILISLAGCTAGSLSFTSAGSTNSSAAGSHTVTTTSTVVSGADTLDLGTWALALSDDDQVTVTATVDPTITFDLDTGLTAGETAAPYSVDLGSLTVGAVNESNATTVNSIFAQLDTNATGGASVTVLSQNAALKSLSVPADAIANSAGTMAAGTTNYGLCVISSTQTTGSFDEGANYTGLTCANASPTNQVAALSTVTPDEILNTAGGPITVGAAEISVNAAINATVPAHNDYQDILTFVATGTF